MKRLVKIKINKQFSNLYWQYHLNEDYEEIDFLKNYLIGM